jgi:chemotaxis protein histidine kinase CheA
MMKNKALFVLVISALLTTGLAGNIIAAPHVDNISLKKQGEFVELTVYADGPFTFSHFIEEAKAGKPFRVVVDLKGCLHKLPQFNFRELPTQVISSIRTSQFKIKPEKMVRIVADIARPVTYMVKQSEGSVTLVFAAPSEKEFEFWCVAPISDAEKIELALKETQSEKVGAPVVMPAHPDVQKKAEDNKEFKPPVITEEQKKSGLQLAQKPTAPKKKPVEKPKVVKKSEPMPEKKVVVAEKQAEPEPEKEVVVAEKKTEMSSEERHALKEKLAGIFSKRKNKDAEKEKQSVKQDESRVAQVDEKKEEPKPAAKPTFVKPDNQVVPERKKLLTDSQPVKPLPHDEEVIEDNIKDPANSSTPVKDAEKAKQKDWKSEKDLRKNPERPPKSKGSLAASFPKREVIRYKSYGRRDPFMALVSKALTGYQNGDLPDVETLRLVGVLNGDDTDMALLEDIEGYGYILEDGDKIKNGYVIQIYNNKILFQINEMGWSRSVALTLDEE